MRPLPGDVVTPPGLSFRGSTRSLPSNVEAISCKDDHGEPQNPTLEKFGVIDDERGVETPNSPPFDGSLGGCRMVEVDREGC